MSTPPARCTELIPESWKKGVGSIPLPGFEDVGEIVTAFIAQSGQVEKADARTADTIHIYETCERLQNEARPRNKVLGIF